MLEKAEDPEKLIKLMIQEIEDTLVEIKASCAGAMANRTRVVRSLEEAKRHAQSWSAKARKAVERERENLAREALLEKRRIEEETESLGRESEQYSELIEQYQQDIVQLEEKLAGARKKHGVLVQRHIHAQKQKRAHSSIRQTQGTDAFSRFESFENRIERLEADAELINYGVKPTLEDELEKIETDDEIEKQLAELKSKIGSQSESEK
jgi:phage shock protein A